MPTNSTEAGAPPTGLLAGVIVVLVTLVLALVLAEVVLRIATPFPVGYSSNKAVDPDLGYRLSRDFAEADAAGFRNAAGTGFDVLAIGDSHTYGNNVGPAATWPAVLARDSRLQVYNAGVGSYGILAYHALLQSQRRSETRAAIIALYPGNDFAPVNSNCQIIREPSEFWQQEAAALGLTWPALKKTCAEVGARSLSDWLAAHSAIAGATQAALSGKRELPAGEPRYDFPDGVQPLLVERVVQHDRSTDPDSPVTVAMLDNLARMAARWSRVDGIKVGVMILPARERVVYGYFEKRGRLGELAPEFVAQLQSQIELEQRSAQILTAAGLPWRHALPEVLAAFEAGLAAGQDFYPGDDDGHPLAAGYAAYAATAQALLGDMGIAAVPQ